MNKVINHILNSGRKNELKNKELAKDEMILDALCAYRDSLHMRSDFWTSEVQDKLELTKEGIADVLIRIRIR